MGRKEAEEGAEDQCRGRGVAGRVVDRSRLTPGPGGAGMLAGESLLSLLLRPSLLSSTGNPPGYGGGAHRGRAGAVEASAEERKASSPGQKELLSPGPSYS